MPLELSQPWPKDDWPVPPPAIESVPETVGGAKVKVPPALVIEFPMTRPSQEVAVEVPKVMAPYWAVPPPELRG